MTKATYHGHDLVSAQMASDIMKRMRFSTDVIEPVTEAIRCHMMAHDMADTKKDYKLRRFMGSKYIDLIEQLVTADEIATVNDKSSSEVHFSDVRKKAQERFPIMLPDPIITGADLIEAGFTPGPAFKDALKHVFNRQLNGEVNRTKLLNAAKGFVKTWKFKG